MMVKVVSGWICFWSWRKVETHHYGADIEGSPPAALHPSFPFYPPFPFNFPREPRRRELRIFPSSLWRFPDPKKLRFGEEKKQKSRDEGKLRTVYICIYVYVYIYSSGVLSFPTERWSKPLILSLGKE